MIVMKFGGSSLANAGRIRKAVSIVQSNVGKNPVVVVSALGGVTDMLISAARLALSGRQKKELDAIVDRHMSAVRELGIDPGTVEGDLTELSRIIEGISLLSELTPRTLDKVVSFGERMSSKIVAAHMRAGGMDAQAFNAYDVGLLTDSNFGDADYLPEAEAGIRRALLWRRRGIPVITGYVGRDRDGNITTLGRGGSDYTAAIFGAALNAKEIQIWTDVNGIMTSDPRIVKSAISIGEVSYGEASELAFMGAKVLHPKTILPAVNKQIPVRILNTFNPSHKGTVVLKDIGVKRRVASIAYKKRIKVINIHNPSMFLAHGFMKRIFEVFDSFGVSVDMIATSDVNVSMTLDEGHDIGGLLQELRKMAQVEVRSNRAKISLVGKDMAFIPGLFGKLFSSLRDIRVEMISSSTSEINQSFVVREEDADETIRRLHKEFFGR